jgi:hypothetical protein
MARSHVNRLARFSSPDPAGLAAANLAFPQSWNRYAYVLNSPLNYVDPLGLCTDTLTTGSTQTADGPMITANFVICPAFQPWLTFPNFVCNFFNSCSSGGGSSNTVGGGGSNSSGGVDKSGHPLYHGPTPCTLARRKAAVDGLVNIGIGALKIAGGVSLTGGTGGVGVAFGGYLVVSGLVSNIGGGLAQIGGAITGNLRGGEQGANAAAAVGTISGFATLVGSGGNARLAGNVGRVEALAVSPFSLAHGGALEGLNSGRELLGGGNEPLACGE